MSIYGTLVTSVLALVLAVPLAFGIAFYLTELAPAWLRRPVGTAIELLAAVPSIIYGMWGFFVIVPIMATYDRSRRSSTRSTASRCCRTCSPGRRSAPASSPPALILAVMVIPFIAATMRDVFETVPAVYKESAYGVGCTTWEVMRSIVSPTPRTSVVGGIMLGLGRALGETMAVTFVIGNANRISDQPVRLGQHHRLAGRAGVSRKPGRQPEALLAAGARVHPVRDLVHRAGDLAAAAAARS